MTSDKQTNRLSEAIRQNLASDLPVGDGGRLGAMVRAKAMMPADSGMYAATSFAELDQADQVAALSDLAGKLNLILDNIIASPLVTDKAAAIRAAVAEYEQRLGQEMKEKAADAAPTPSGLVNHYQSKTGSVAGGHRLLDHFIARSNGAAH